MARPIAKVLTGFALLAAALVVGAIYFALRQSAPVAPPLPNPNGYEDLVKAAGMLDRDFWDYRTMSQEELVTVVAKNAEALSLARKGLDRESLVPLDYSATDSGHLRSSNGSHTPSWPKEDWLKWNTTHGRRPRNI